MALIWRLSHQSSCSAFLVKCTAKRWAFATRQQIHTWSSGFKCTVFEHLIYRSTACSEQDEMFFVVALIEKHSLKLKHSSKNKIKATIMLQGHICIRIYYVDQPSDGTTRACHVYISRSYCTSTLSNIFINLMYNVSNQQWASKSCSEICILNNKSGYIDGIASQQLIVI